jgi:hypothetical protein
MKGCFGCVLVIVAILVIAVVGLGILFLSTNVFSGPDVKPAVFTKNDGYAAQQKLFEIASRQSGRSSRRDPITITEPEANAFLSKHLDQSGLPLSPIVVRFTQGEVLAQGQTAFRNLLKGPPFAQIAPYLSTKKLDEPVWVTVGGRIKIEGTGTSRHGSVEVTQFALGKQPLGSILLQLLMGSSGGGLLQWPVPAVVDEVRIGEGQLSITTR